MLNAVEEAVAAIAGAWRDYAEAPVTVLGASEWPSPAALFAAVDRLKPFLPGWDPAAGAMVWEDPGYDDDIYGPEHGLTAAQAEALTWESAGFEVVYQAHLLRGRRSLASLCWQLNELGNHIGQLASWHPRYNADTGEIPTSGDLRSLAGQGVLAP